MKRPDDRQVIHLAEIGSTGHGVTHSTNDLDEIAVFVPTPQRTVGLVEDETYVYRPGRQPHEPSGPGDLDRVYHSLRKFTRLLVKGNPSILYVLFAPTITSTWLGRELVDRRTMLAHTSTRARYLGYMRSQRERIQGTRGAAGRIRRSPEGGGEIDWKYAMHMLRLGHQCWEYLTTLRIAAPVDEPLRSHLIDVRAGRVPLGDVVAEARNLERDVEALSLPPFTEEAAFTWSAWLADAHRRWWDNSPYRDLDTRPWVGPADGAEPALFNHQNYLVNMDPA